MDALARLRRRDCGALRDDELDVAAALGEDEVARLEAREADAPADVELAPGRARDLHSDRAVGRVDETRAVEARPARGAAPAVADAELVPGERDDLLHAGRVLRSRRRDPSETGLGPRG